MKVGAFFFWEKIVEYNNSLISSTFLPWKCQDPRAVSQSAAHSVLHIRPGCCPSSQPGPDRICNDGSGVGEVSKFAKKIPLSPWVDYRTPKETCLNVHYSQFWKRPCSCGNHLSLRFHVEEKIYKQRGSLSQSILDKVSRMVAHVRPLDHLFHESREMLLLKEPCRSFQKYTIGWSWAVGWPDAALRICKSDMRETNLRCLDCVWSCEEQILPVVFGRLP